MILIWLHLVTAVLALCLGSLNLALAKGTPRHRAIGWIWIFAMLSVTLSSFGIRELNAGALSWIHGLTVVSLVSMGLAIGFVRRGQIRSHAGCMIGSMAGIVLAGAFAVAPGRFVSRLLGS